MGKLKESAKQNYPVFKKLNGEHPLKSETLDSFVDYQVRTRRGGHLRFFNFELAKEIGLIPQNHAEELNSELEEEILQTFGIVIINEFDQLKERKFPPEDIRPNKYMATRYLQLQHPNKQGKTSGDGRSIWNGHLRHGGTTYDISSCGTGATSLSPATAIKGRFFETGNSKMSYGCGYSEIDEGLGTLFFSEVLHKNDISTERVLAIIEYEDEYGITVRVHPNLLRPSHLFNHVKQASYPALEAMVEYYIKRQESNGEWKDVPQSKNERYQYFLEKQILAFAKTAAKYEDEYIFVWMDWDGDNVLMDGGIIDYGSVRQFGLFHSEYRFDDGPRFSTSILEQKHKAKYMVQTFAQIADYLITKKRRPIKEFRQHYATKKFEQHFEECKWQNLLYKIGFTSEQSTHLLQNHAGTVKNFLKAFSYFERAKSHIGPIEVSDGINWNAIFCMRDVLRELPQRYLQKPKPISKEDFIEIMRSSYATKKDLKLNTYRHKRIAEFQTFYWDLIKVCAEKRDASPSQILQKIIIRSSIINRYDRVTGDSVTHVVNEIMAKRKKLKPKDIYRILKNFSEYQDLNPERKHPLDADKDRSKLMREIVDIVKDYREGL